MASVPKRRYSGAGDMPTRAVRCSAAEGEGRVGLATAPATGPKRASARKPTISRRTDEDSGPGPAIPAPAPHSLAATKVLVIVVAAVVAAFLALTAVLFVWP